MIDWNVVVTLRGGYRRAIALLRRLGVVEPTGMYNVVAMWAPDVRVLLDEIGRLVGDEPFLEESVSHVVPVTHKLSFADRDGLERGLRDLLIGWAPTLAGKRVRVRVRCRGAGDEMHPHHLETRLGEIVLDETGRRGAQARIAFEDPDAIVVVETIRSSAGVALWTREDLVRYPLLRRSIEHHPRPLARPTADHLASAAEISEVLGEVDPIAMEKLLAIGAQLGEVIEAARAIEDEDAFAEAHHEPSSPRVAELRAVLEELVLEGPGEGELEPTDEAMRP